MKLIACQKNLLIKKKPVSGILINMACFALLFQAIPHTVHAHGHHSLLSASECAGAHARDFKWDQVPAVSVTLTGKTVDESGAPVPGVTISEKGTTNHSISKENGTFSITVKSSKAVLLISHIGYTTKEVKVNNQTDLTISLSGNSTNLNDVVVIGYGSMQKSNLSSAQTSIKADQIEKTVNTTVEQAIQGRSAGVYVTQNSGQPGGGMSVNIRGISTINGSTEPLYVIDGVQSQPGTLSYGPMSSVNALSGLNPADIETIDILQGPSATAIYGSRASNGVVLITTKRGKSGDMKVGYNYGYSLQAKPKPIATMTLQQYAVMMNEMLSNAPLDPEFIDPSILGKGTDWQEALFKTAALHKHQLSVSGGNDKTTLYLSGEYFDQDGVARGSGFKRYNFRLNIDNKTRKWLKLGANLNFNQTNEKLTSTQNSVISTAIQIAPHIPVTNPDGSWGGSEDRADGKDEYFPINPVALASLVKNDLNKRAANLGLNAEITLLKGLIFRATANGSINYSTFQSFTPTYTLGSRTNDVAVLNVWDNQSTYYNLNQLLQYNHTIKKHVFGVMASHEAQASTYKALQGSRSGFVTNALPDLNVGNPTGATNGGGNGDWAQESYLGRINYTYNNKYIFQAVIRTDGSGNFGDNKKWGTFPSASAAWRVSEEPFMKGIKFINEFKIRLETGRTGNQGSRSIYAELNAVATPWGAGFYVGRYGNMDLLWEQTRTDNIGLNLSLFNNRIQLEADYYSRGTSNMLMPLVLPGYMGTIGAGSIAPPTYNVGSLNNKGFGITLNATVVNEKRFSWKTNFNISSFKTKITKFNANSAYMDRSVQGLTQRSIVGEAPWLMYGYVYDGIFQTIEEINNSPIPLAANGTRLPVKRTSGVYIGDIKYKDLNGDKVIDERDQTYIGNPWPKFTAGFTNTFSYGDFDLSVLLIGTFGNDIYNQVRVANTLPDNIYTGRNMLLETYGYARIISDGSGKEILANPGGNIPRVTWGSDVNGNSTRRTNRFIEDGTYIRIKNVQLSYTVPKEILSGQHVVKSAVISFGVQNLYTFTKYKGFDPEIGNYVGPDVVDAKQLIGLDAGRYPLTRMYNFNVGVNF